MASNAATPPTGRPVRTVDGVDSHKLVAGYAATLCERSAPGRGQPEEQIRRSFEELIEAVGNTLNLAPKLVGEETVKVVGRPDFGVYSHDVLVGHAELKQPGKGANPDRYKGHDREQWNRFKTLPNLLYSDGVHFGLYRTGQRVGRLVGLGEILDDGAQAVSPDAAERLFRLVADFLQWKPVIPKTVGGLAETLAPLCRWLRDDVAEALGTEGSALESLAGDWKETLFPDADHEQFADAYAQTLTYALLLARLDGADPLDERTAVEALRGQHGLLAEALEVLTHYEARRELEVGIGLLLRVIGAVERDGLQGSNPWLHFYEDFLAAYDPTLRRDRGVYYTPTEVVRCQARLVEELLVKRLGKELGYAETGVITLDPAAGTGTYPLECIQLGLERCEETYGSGGAAARATVLASNIHAFELLVGPYAVAHLRISQAITDAGGTLPDDGTNVYLTDTLEPPYAEPPQTSLWLRAFSEEHKRAVAVKADAKVMVCLGNPPYDRQTLELGSSDERKGGWVRFGEEGGRSGILEDFIKPAQKSGAALHIKSLYNDYVYFWRWALWKVFEQTEGPGVVSFITASSYLRGPGFVGMRKLLRQHCDELWVLDLEGDQLGPRKTENVFAIRTPVAIAIAVRYGQPQPEVPATVWYGKLTGPTEEKLSQLDGIRQLKDISWQSGMQGWTDPLLPKAAGAYFQWPLLTDLFPWQTSGSQFKRTWPIAPTRELLKRRWAALVSSPADERSTLFRPADRKVDSTPASLDAPNHKPPSVAQLDGSVPSPPPRRYSYRSLNRCWALIDNRLCDRLRPGLWRTHSESQVYLTSLLTTVLGAGPAAIAAADPPDLHHFSNRGAKDVIPLWRDAAGAVPNLADGIQQRLAETYGRQVGGDELFCYAYALLSAPAFTEWFSEELSVPGPRLPVAAEVALFDQAVREGRELLRLHTYNERFTDRQRPLDGTARCTRAVPDRRDDYPRAWSYDAEQKKLTVGDGLIGPVSPEVASFAVSGYRVLDGWLDYRMAEAGGRKSSPLDELRPDRWTAEMTEELLRLLWVLEATVAAHPRLNTLLETVVAGELLAADAFPAPAEADRSPLLHNEPHSPTLNF